jgi:hypothetical protein
VQARQLAAKDIVGGCLPGLTWKKRLSVGEGLEAVVVDVRLSSGWDTPQMQAVAKSHVVSRALFISVLVVSRSLLYIDPWRLLLIRGRVASDILKVVDHDGGVMG